MSFLIIGTGAIGKRHANNLIKLGETVKTISIQNDGLSGLKRTLKSNTFEAAIICTATQLRAEVISLLAAKPMPVYIEKPVAYNNEELDRITDVLGDLTHRSFAGFMMRYHPAVQYLANLTQPAYRFAFDIGHDVNQWRENWNFADSYASNPNGGGVLLDLCHELDMAQTTCGPLKIDNVSSFSHPDFPDVDFTTSIAAHSDNGHGSINMDYISPVSTRKISIWCADQTIMFDLANDDYRVTTRDGTKQLDLSIDRQKMFQEAMADFVRLVRGKEVMNPIAPVLPLEIPTCRNICNAYEQREFIGQIRSR